METFLSEVARRLYAEHPDSLDNVTVVFNNRRSGLFLRRQFAAMEEKAFLLPRIIGIDELVAELGGLRIVPNEFLLFELFDIHRGINPENDKFDTFEDFISFGDMMLADFSEIDLYCVDSQQLFSNLHDLKAIGEWDIETGRLTPFQEKYLKFYQSLYQYYAQLHERLLAEGRAYSGMAYRNVAEHIDSMAANDVRKYYFVGFNAISACEERIIRHYIRQGNGEIISDGDAYYYDDESQEAGRFLRKHHENSLLTTDSYTDHFAIGHKDITLVECPENIIQCKYAGQILAQQPANSDPSEQTAVVLADESLLLPMLNALPSNIRKANVTMGYPLTCTAAHALMLKLFSLHAQRRQSRFYHPDILGVLADDNISKLHGIKNIHSRLNAILAKGHIIYADGEEIAGLCRQLGGDWEAIRFLFPSGEPTPDEFLNMAHGLVHALYGSHCLDTNIKEKEALASLLQIIEYLQELQTQYHFISSSKALLKIYTRLAQRHSVPFYGEPLQGLQILGVLETRNLDFKHVILISANEGTLPSGRTPNTLIPYNLKTAFGIPTFHEKDAVYAYNFYRLLQRADTVHLLYHTESDGIGKGEPSRFILQVDRELAKRYPHSITLRKEVLSMDSRTSPAPERLSYPKSPQIMDEIRRISKYGFSPTALNKYRSCPLKFYYENILGVTESDPVSEDLEQSDLGSCIHAVLENIYTPEIGKELRPEVLRSALDNLDGLIAEALEDQFHHGRSHEGRNHFLESVAKMQIANFLKSEIANLDQGDKVVIECLEERLCKTLPVDVCGDRQQVDIAGKADRIDSWNGCSRVIDYKSGKAEPKELQVKEAEPDWANVPDKWFQVMLYTWLFHYSKPSNKPHIAGIQPLKNLQQPFMAASWEGSEQLTPEHLAAFEKMLQELIADILNPEIPFIANPGCQSCKYCPFAEICQRTEM